MLNIAQPELRERKGGQKEERKRERESLKTNVQACQHLWKDHKHIKHLWRGFEPIMHRRHSHRESAKCIIAGALKRMTACKAWPIGLPLAFGKSRLKYLLRVNSMEGTKDGLALSMNKALWKIIDSKTRRVPTQSQLWVFRFLHKHISDLVHMFSCHSCLQSRVWYSMDPT